MVSDRNDNTINTNSNINNSKQSNSNKQIQTQKQKQESYCSYVILPFNLKYFFNHKINSTGTHLSIFISHVYFVILLLI